MYFMSIFNRKSLANTWLKIILVEVFQIPTDLEIFNFFALLEIEASKIAGTLQSSSHFVDPWLKLKYSLLFTGGFFYTDCF